MGGSNSPISAAEGFPTLVGRTLSLSRKIDLKTEGCLGMAVGLSGSRAGYGLSEFCAVILCWSLEEMARAFAGHETNKRNRT